MSTKRKYRKLPVIIEAVKWEGTYDSLGEVAEFLGFSPHYNNCGNPEPELLYIPTLEGEMTASKGDYIIRGIKGEFYPCKADVFESSYEECHG